MSLKGSPVSSKFTSQFKVFDMYRKLELQCERHQFHRYTSMFTMFGSSDDRVLLTMYRTELKYVYD